MLHAMGGKHEQSRIDRPHYIEITWNNIINGYANNFDVADTKDDAPYDLSSVMQYGLGVRRIVFSPSHGSCRSVAPALKNIRMNDLGATVPSTLKTVIHS